MTPLMYAHLVKAMDKLLEDSDFNNERPQDGYVYEMLAEDMADAAKSVYNACMAGQKFAKDNRRG